MRSLLESFVTLEDPRDEKNKQHRLIDIVIIGVCAVIGGCEGWEHIEEFAMSKESWFRKFLELPNGIPSYSTIRRVFVLLNAQEFQRCFMFWVEGLKKLSCGGDVIAIDGKTLRRSYDRTAGMRALHMVSAWSHANSMVLGQLRTEEKSNEITAIPELLSMLYLKGSIVTIDAMGCQSNIAEQIVQQQGDYILALKGNQGRLLQDVSLYLKDAQSREFNGTKNQFFQQVEKGHGRIETRSHWVTDQIDWLRELHPQWQSIKSIARVESIRQIGSHTSTEVRYYITSIESNAMQFAHALRSHWEIENLLHWSLDFTFREDESRIRSGFAAQNFAVLRHMALSLLKREHSYKKSLKLKRMKAGWDVNYLQAVLNL